MNILFCCNNCNADIGEMDKAFDETRVYIQSIIAITMLFDMF